MTMRRESSRLWIATVVWLALAVFALGAGPNEPWQADRPNLPPVTIAPGISPVPNTQPVALPRPMPAPSVRGDIPPAKPFPGAPSAMPARPAVTPPARMAQAPPVGAPTPNLAPNTRVYIFDGVDPFGWDGISQMADRIRDSGYPETRLGGWYQVLQFDREIRKAHREDPNTQFIIIGYSFGVYRARALAGRLEHDGIPIAMVGYIGGDYLRNSPASNRLGTGRMVNVMGDGYLLTGRNLFFNGTDLDGAENMRMPGVRHFSLPKQDQTVSTLVNGMNAATARTWTSAPVVANSAGVPGRIMTGPETIRQQPAQPTYPAYATGRR